MKRPVTSWSEILGQAMHALRANKLRATLSVLGVVIGSACIVLVVTVALTGRKYISAQIQAVGSNIVYANLSQASTRNATLADAISLGDLRAVQQNIPQVVRAAGTTDISMSVVAGGKSHPVALIGVTREFQQIRNLIILRGRYFDDTDFSTVSKVCVISQHLAHISFPYENPVGRNLHVGELMFTVIGVFRERIDTFGQSEIRRDSVLVPFPLIGYYTGNNSIRTLYAQADSPGDVPLVTKSVADVLRGRHRPEVEYDVENLTSILAASRNISMAMTGVLLFVALLALAISGIGITNIMLVSVTERTREIGIRKAIGARRPDILYQFLLEAVLISVVGGMVGITLAVAIPVFVEALVHFLPVPRNMTIPISGVSVLAAFLVSCVTGILAGYLPAKTAAKLQPVEALRYE